MTVFFIELGPELRVNQLSPKYWREMSRKQGVSAAEKKKRILGLFHQSCDFYNLKEIEKLGVKAGVVEQSIKGVVEELVCFLSFFLFSLLDFRAINANLLGCRRTGISRKGTIINDI
jgi:hypothetical protein